MGTHPECDGFVVDSTNNFFPKNFVAKQITRREKTIFQRENVVKAKNYGGQMKSILDDFEFFSSIFRI